MAAAGPVLDESTAAAAAGPGPDVTTAGRPSKTANRQLKAQARSAEGPMADEYARGQADARAGRDPEPPFDSDLGPYYQAGHDDARAQMAGADREGAQTPPPAGRSSAPASRSRWNPLAGAGPVDSGAGLLLGAILYANVVNFLRGGLPAVKGWWAAKFLNHPYSGALSAPSYQPSATTTALVAGAGTAASTPIGPPVGVPPVLSSAAGGASTSSTLA